VAAAAPVASLALGGVVYQVYVRSFADSNGDGVGDLPGIVGRLDYLADLGVDALWLSPVHPSPNVDWGYDVADYRAVHPDYGTLADLDALIAGAGARGIDIWLDLVPNHTSDAHTWFRDRPEYYVWAERIPNDWTSVFTGETAWQFDSTRRQYYLHQFAPEQPDLDWWNAAVRNEFDDILRFWFNRGVSGFRIDVAHGLIKDSRLRSGQKYMNRRPEVHEIYRRWQEIAGEYVPKPTLMGETYVPLDELFDYFEHLDLAQNFPFLLAEFEIDELRPIVETTMDRLPKGRDPVWFGSNHDHSRMATRWAGGDERKHMAALFLILTLPGSSILYQGDELGLEDGAVPRGRILDVADPPRDPARTPFPWTRSGKEWPSSWLPATDTSRNVEDSAILAYTRGLIAQRRRLGDGYRTLPSEQGVWAYARGATTCVLNMTGGTAAHDGVLLEPWQGLIHSSGERMQVL
jgi:alpha-glucosidase